MQSGLDAAAAHYESNRRRLIGLAARLLGSTAEAEDVVQDAWLRLTKVGPDAVEDFGAWFSTVVARAAIDRLRLRRRRAESPLGHDHARALEAADPARDPEAEAVFVDAVGVALVVVLDRLKPAERLAFVLHDLFGLSCDEVGAVIDRSPAAARQLASRARRRVRGAPPDRAADLAARAEVVAAFAVAARGGDLSDLLRVLDPDVTLTLDTSMLPPNANAPRTVTGAPTVAARARIAAGAAELMLVDGQPGLVVVAGAKVERVLAFQVEGLRIRVIDVIVDPIRLRRLDLRLMPAHLEGRLSDAVVSPEAWGDARAPRA